MNRQTFSEYLDQPSKLYQLSLTELQGLVLEYPYSANLRQLLLLKAKLENHPRAEEMLNQAAARTFDRGYLFELLQEMERNGLETLGQQEKLELQDLNRLEFELMPAHEVEENATQNVSAPEPYPMNNDLANLVADEIKIETDSAEAFNFDLDSTPPTEATVDISEEELEVGDVIDLSPLPTFDAGMPEVTPRKEIVLATPDMRAAVAVSEIVSSWYADYEPTQPVPIAELDISTPKPRNKLSERLKRHKQLQLQRLNSDQPGDSLNEIARKSVASQREVASETLAQLLVRQGQYAKAIKMYKRLGLLYPEKKSIFAGLIKDLKEKL